MGNLLRSLQGTNLYIFLSEEAGLPSLSPSQKNRGCRPYSEACQAAVKVMAKILPTPLKERNKVIGDPKCRLSVQAGQSLRTSAPLVSETLKVLHN